MKLPKQVADFKWLIVQSIARAVNSMAIVFFIPQFQQYSQDQTQDTDYNFYEFKISHRNYLLVLKILEVGTSKCFSTWSQRTALLGSFKNSISQFSIKYYINVKFF